MSTKYDELGQQLKKAQSAASAAEAHGFASGWIASGTNWQSAPVTFQQTLELTSMEAVAPLMSKYAEEIAAGLCDVDFGFQLFLPDEGVVINERREALSDWCRGFLSGFGLTGRFQDAELSDEVKELLRDFSQIAQVDDDIPEDDENESDLVEITEYVRMGAIMVYTDCATKAVH